MPSRSRVAEVQARRHARRHPVDPNPPPARRAGPRTLEQILVMDEGDEHLGLLLGQSQRLCVLSPLNAGGSAQNSCVEICGELESRSFLLSAERGAGCGST